MQTVAPTVLVSGNILPQKANSGNGQAEDAQKLAHSASGGGHECSSYDAMWLRNVPGHDLLFHELSTQGEFK